MSSYWLLTQQAGIGPFPSAPPRMDVLTARVGFQGVSVSTEQFGWLRAWGPELGSLTDADADGYVRQVLGAGFSAVEFAVSWNYRSPSFWYPVPGSDLSQNLAELRRRVKRAIQVGAPLGLTGVFIFCAGDGEGAGPGYNDPYGWTYGRSWLMANFARIYTAFGPQPDDPTDLRDWLVFLPGYDGCDAYAWTTGQHVADWWQLQRRTMTAGGYLGFEWPAGQIQLGDGFPTYAPENGGVIDLWLLEGPTGRYPPSDTQSIQQLTQQIGRAVRPYNRPSWAVDDPHPPLLVPTTNTLGLPTVVQLYEFSTYDWVRGCSLEQVNQNRAVLREMAPETVIC